MKFFWLMMLDNIKGQGDILNHIRYTPLGAELSNISTRIAAKPCLSI